MKPRITVRKARAPGPALPPATDWRTTDADELAKRKLRAREERHRITNVDRAHPVFSNFEIQSPSGMTYRAEIRDVASRQFSCTCTDFRINGLGTCKHIEAILLQLARRPQQSEAAARSAHTLRRRRSAVGRVGSRRIGRGDPGLAQPVRADFAGCRALARGPIPRAR